MAKTKTPKEIFNKYADKYQDKFMDFELYHDTFDVFCEYVKRENADILEIACGPGNITKYLLKRRPDFKILGIDIAENMIEFAKSNNPNAHFKVIDCRDISALDKKYDAVMCGFCLPYLSKQETEKLIRDVSRLLNTGGMFYLSTMEKDYEKSGYKISSSGEDQTYIHYYEAGYLTKVLKENCFKIIDIQRKEYPETDGTKTTDLIIIAQK